MIRIKKNQKFQTKDKSGRINGNLITIYNDNDKFYISSDAPKQVYVTTIKVNASKGPHLHYKRQGHFTCIKGNIKIVVKINSKYEEYFSGEDYEFASIIIPKGLPALLVNIDDEEAFVINTPNPAWTEEMNDEHDYDFSDYYIK